ncbi:MAG: helix-turn-helix transcriptional regulator [Acidimicrobiales bacterium]|jgi:predicted ArsR family transcriptional regulator
MPGADKGPEAARVGHGRARQALMSVLRRSGRPLDATEAGRIAGLHRNTARAHLEALVSVGLALRRIELRTTRGRPRVLYEKAGDANEERAASPVGVEIGYLQLAQSLAGQLSEMEDATGEAVRAGRRWAAAVDSSPLSPGRLTPVETIGTVTSLFERLGFDPEPVLDEGRILLHRCPFLEVAKEVRPIVCGMHLGMLKATLERLHAPFEVTGFHPLVQEDPLLCVVKLAEKKSKVRPQEPLIPRRNA